MLLGWTPGVLLRGECGQEWQRHEADELGPLQHVLVRGDGVFQVGLTVVRVGNRRKEGLRRNSADGVTCGELRMTLRRRRREATMPEREVLAAGNSAPVIAWPMRVRRANAGGAVGRGWGGRTRAGRSD
ncbi:MAG: hypothetical protein ACLFO1_01840, partial [Spirochaetaceae bacterium]